MNQPPQNISVISMVVKEIKLKSTH